MIVRNPTALEIEKASEVAAKAFPNLALEHWLKSFNMVAEVFGREYILVVEDGGELVSSLICQPTPVLINGSPVTHATTGAVGTIPEARCKGCAGIMMAETVRLLRRQGVWLSSLWPFSYNYYRKFGWEIGSEIREYNAQSKVFSEFGDPNNVRGAREGDLEGIKKAFAEFAPIYNCLTQRTDVWWSRVLNVNEPITMVTQPGLGVVVHEADDEINGYAAYSLVENEEHLNVNVKEIVFDNPRDRRDMLALLATIDPEGTLSFNAPMTDLFMQEIPNPRVISASIHASFQFRVMDPVRALECYAVDEDISGKLSFSLTDPVFDEGFEFGIDFDEGKVSITKPSPDNMIRTDIQTFARLYSGYLTAFDALIMNKLQVSGDSLPVVALASEFFTPLTPYRSWWEPG